MTSRFQPEVMQAVSAAVRPDDTLISRQRIEEEIETYPEQYPGLSNRTRIGRRRIITTGMNEMFAIWSESQGSRPSSFVWQIRTQAESLCTSPGTQP